MDQQTQSYTLKHKIILVSLVPIFILTAIVSAFFVFMHNQDLTQLERQQSQLLANQLSQSVRIALQREDRALLKELLQSGQNNNHHINHIAVFDPQHNLLDYAGDLNFHNQIVAQLSADQAMKNISMTRYDIQVLVPIYPDPMQHATQSTLTPLGIVAINFDREQLALSWYHFLLLTLLYLCIATTFVYFTTKRLMRHISRPITLLNQFIEKVKRNKPAELPSELNRILELRYLSNNVKELAQELVHVNENMNKSISQATAELQQTLDLIEGQNIELGYACKEAQDNNRVKSEFMANVSHELRTPLNGIIGFTNLLLKTVQCPHQRDYLETIRKSANNLISIINDVLDFAKIDADKMVLDMIQMNLRESVADVLTILAPSAQAKNLELVAIVYEDVPEDIIGDPLRIKQILTNLVNNAIKFTAQGSIIVRVMLDSDPEFDNECFIAIRVSDTGIGLKENEQERLFKAFSQADSSTTRKYGGTGLGLAICKSLVEKMDGEIDVESVEGEGSTFWFTFKTDVVSAHTVYRDPALPIKSVLLNEARSATRLSIQHLLKQMGIKYLEQDKIQDIQSLSSTDLNQYDAFLLGIHETQQELPALTRSVHYLQQHSQKPIVVFVNSTDHLIHEQIESLNVQQVIAKPIHEARLRNALSQLNQPSLVQNPANTPSSTTKTAQDLHILVVDDNEANVKLVSIFLRDMGIKVTTAMNGQQAVDAALDTLFDLIIMDIQMPVMDGVEATQQIRLQGKNRTTPTVALTAHAMPGEREKLLNQGLDDYQTKPVSEEQLATLIDKWARPANPNYFAKNLHKSAQLSLTETSSRNHSAQTFAVIDWQQALDKVGGKSAIALEMLGLLVATLPQDLQQIADSFSQQAWETCIQQVHKLHGGAALCGVPALKQTAHDLESLLKQGDFELATQHLQTLLNAGAEVIQEAPNYIGKAS